MTPTPLFLARLCQIAYEEPMPLTGLVDEVEPFQAEGGGFAARSGENALLVFRGTQTVDDVLIDIHADMAPIATGYAHAGFYETASERLPAYTKALTAILSGGKVSKLFLTGHSLGGALATLAAQEIHYYTSQYAPEICSFGCPRVFDAGAAAAFDKLFPANYRFVNVKDPVPKVPIIFGGRLFKHCGERITLPHGWARYLWQGCPGWRWLWARLRYDYETALAVDIDSHHIDKYVENLSRGPTTQLG